MLVGVGWSVFRPAHNLGCLLSRKGSQTRGGSSEFRLSHSECGGGLAAGLLVSSSLRKEKSEPPWRLPEDRVECGGEDLQEDAPGSAGESSGREQGRHPSQRITREQEESRSSGFQGSLVLETVVQVPVPAK